ncbi:serine/threonine protein kinase [Streptomyces piniterrae]|uniref:non-specific serine/threonine protein kinase n=1 Tax=Streptomyces piniterrae TaxID=2571125 RepID=A0A4U0NFP5_9ACTN|nr:serine/threonine-protein kinase [Streptomyces piniterrae]TJZ52955.1 serine/threonine protein kinase [Streptomyces piniterrae]
MGIFGGEGRLIGGRYRLGIRLGRGGMGTVWQATDELLGRQVAVKELHLDEGTAEPEARQQRDRAIREARTVAQIKHPNVIVMHDVVEQDGQPWIVMELVEGKSLADRLYSGGPVAPREAARIGLALLGALRAAHTRGVLHRDLKPANVLIEAGTGRVVLTDFGIAQVPGVTTVSEPGGFVGSPEYTAPERMEGRGTGPEADLWSLGVLLCAALNGESPFRRDSLGGVLHAVVYDEIDIPEAARPLRAVVQGLLERLPQRRLDIAETERLLRGYLHSGRAPERGAGGSGGAGGAGGLWGQHGGAGQGAAAAAVAGGPGGPGPRALGGPVGPGPSGPGSHAPLHDGADGVRPGEHPPAEEQADGRPLPGSTPRATPPDPHPFQGFHGPTPPGPGPGHPVGPPAGRLPGVPIPDALDDRALAAAVRPPTRRARAALLVALAVVVIGGAGAGLTALLLNGNGDDPKDTIGRTQQASHGRTAPASGSASETPRPSVTVPSEPTVGITAKAPAGYRIVRDPVGFALAVPEGFTRSYENDRVYYYSQGKRFRIGVQLQKQVPEGPIGAMRTADAEGPADYRGYRQGRVTETTHNGYQAGLWEFVWDGSATDGGSRYTYDLSWNEGGKMMDVWISAPVGSRDEAKRHLDTAVDAFQLTG